MARLWAKTVTFESVSIGDELPILVKWETEETIARFNAVLNPESAEPDPDEIPDDVTGTADSSASSPALAAYVLELLEKGFPITSIVAQGSRLQLHPMRPVKPEDTITLTGSVVNKRQEEDHRLVECEVSIENQNGQIVARAEAVVSL